MRVFGSSLRLAWAVGLAVLLPTGPGAGEARAASGLPRLVVTADDTEVRASCEIVIPPGTILRDADTNGVLRIAADGITVRFAPGSELRGAAAGPPGIRCGAPASGWMAIGR